MSAGVAHLPRASHEHLEDGLPGEGILEDFQVVVESAPPPHKRTAVNGGDGASLRPKPGMRT